MGGTIDFIRRPRPIAFVTAIIAAFSPAARGARTAGDSLEAISRAAYQQIWQFDPVVATCQGVHAFDDSLASFSPRTVDRQVEALNGFLDRTEKLDTSSLSLDDRIDRALLASNLKIQLLYLDRFPAWRKNPKLYVDECVQGIYFPALRNFAPVAVRARNISRRLAQVPRVIDEARRNVQNPPRTYAEAAISELETGEQFFAEVARAFGDSVPGERKPLAVNSQKAIAACRNYRSELKRSLSTLKDDFALGRGNYDYLLTTDDLFAFDSDSLLRLGENLYARTDSEIQALSRERDAFLKLHPAGKGPLLVPPRDFSKKDIFAGEQAAIDTMKNWVSDRAIATVPGYVGRLTAIETPPFLRSIIPGLAMEPPAPLDSNQTSFLYIPAIPEPLDSAAKQRYYTAVERGHFKGGIVHEGFPGHHLQLSIANHQPSFIRRLQANIPLIEGWALYCEQLAADQGLYPDDGYLALRWLGGVNFRALRVVLDVKLQTGQLTYDQAWRFMVEKTGADSSFCQGEVRRYCLSPTQPMSYLVGKTQIMALRDAYAKKTGVNFSLKDFHDRLLAEGSIPIALIRKKLLGE